MGIEELLRIRPDEYLDVGICPICESKQEHVKHMEKELREFEGPINEELGRLRSQVNYAITYVAQAADAYGDETGSLKERYYRLEAFSEKLSRIYKRCYFWCEELHHCLKDYERKQRDMGDGTEWA